MVGVAVGVVTSPLDGKRNSFLASGRLGAGLVSSVCMCNKVQRRKKQLEQQQHQHLNRTRAPQARCVRTTHVPSGCSWLSIVCKSL